MNKEESKSLIIRPDQEHQGYMLCVCPVCSAIALRYKLPTIVQNGEELGYCKVCGQKIHFRGA